MFSSALKQWLHLRCSRSITRIITCFDSFVALWIANILNFRNQKFIQKPNGQILEIKKSFQKSNGQILAIKTIIVKITRTRQELKHIIILVIVLEHRSHHGSKI